MRASLTFITLNPGQRTLLAGYLAPYDSLPSIYFCDLAVLKKMQVSAVPVDTPAALADRFPSLVYGLW